MPRKYQTFQKVADSVQSYTTSLQRLLLVQSSNETVTGRTYISRDWTCVKKTPNQSQLYMVQWYNVLHCSVHRYH